MSFGDLDRVGFSLSHSVVNQSGEGMESSSVSLQPVSSEQSKAFEEISLCIFRISSDTASIRRLCEKLGTDVDSHELREKINELSEKVKVSITSTSAELRRVGAFPHLQPVEKLRLQKLTKDFHAIMGRFQSVQRQSLDKCRDFVVRAKAIARDTSILLSKSTNSASGPGSAAVSEDQHVAASGGDDDEHSEEESAPLIQVQQERRQQLIGLQNEIDYNQGLILEREEGIREIEAVMADINELFRNVATIVSEQQCAIDNIEANMEISAVRTRGAVVELERANEYRRRARSQSCCAILFAVFVTVIVSTIILSM